MLQKQLKQISFFRHWPQAALVQLAKVAELKTYDANRIIFKEGGTRDRLQIVISGAVVVEKNILGQQEPLAVFKPYDILSEHVIVSPGGKHHHTGKSYVPDTTILTISVLELLKIFRHHPRAAFFSHQATLSILNTRLEQTNDKLLTLFAISKLSNTAKNVADLGETLLETLLKIFEVKKGLLCSFEPAGQKANIIAALGYGKKYIPDNIALSSDTVLSLIYNTHKSLIISSQNWERKFSSAAYATKNMLLVPLAIKKRLVGCIILADKNNNNMFSLNNEILLMAIAEQIAPILDQFEQEEYQRNAINIHQRYIDPFNGLT